MAFFQQNGVAVLLFKISIPRSIKKNQRRVEQTPQDLEKKQNRKLILKTPPTLWYGLGAVWKPCSRDSRDKLILIP